MDTFTVQHMSKGGCLDSQTFYSYDDMEDYIDRHILPLWERGDYLVCNGVKRIVFDNY